MFLFEAMLTALFCMVVVFCVLTLIWVVTKLFSFTLQSIEKKLR